MVSGGNTRVNMNASVASQSGKAFAKMGEDLASVGIQVSGMFEKAAKVHEEGEMIKLQQELDEMYAGYDKQMLETPNDVMKWREGWDKLTAKKQLELDGRDMSNSLRQQVNAYAGANFSKRGISISGNQTRTVISNTQKSARTRLNDLEARGDYDEHDRAVYGMVQNNILPQWEADERTAKISRKRDEDSLINEMKENPPLFQQNYNEGKYENSNIHPDKVAQIYSDSIKIGEAQQVDAYKRIDNNSYPSMDALQKDPDYLKLTPKQKINAEKSYNDKLDTAKANYYRDPKNHNEIQGRQESIISQIRRGKLSRVDGLAELKSNQKFVNDPVSKARYEEEIENIEADKKYEAKSIKDFGLDIIDIEFDSREDQNPKPKPVTTTRKQAIMLDEDFFTEANLKGYGIKDKYIDDIIEAEADVGGKDLDISGFDDQVMKDAQMNALIAILKTPKAIDTSVKLAEDKQQIRDSILAGQPSDVITSHIPAKATSEYQDKLRQINIDRSMSHDSYQKFMRINPNATKQEVLKHITGEEKMIKSNSGSSIISAPPTRTVTPNN